jgi:hypothetical protein
MSGFKKSNGAPFASIRAQKLCAQFWRKLRKGSGNSVKAAPFLGRASALDALFPPAGRARMAHHLLIATQPLDSLSKATKEAFEVNRFAHRLLTAPEPRSRDQDHPARSNLDEKVGAYPGGAS